MSLEVCYKIAIITTQATKINAVGTYSHTEKSVLICVVNKHRLNDFQNIIAKYDNTFSFYELINETYGNFKYIK